MQPISPHIITIWILLSRQYARRKAAIKRLDALWEKTFDEAMLERIEALRDRTAAESITPQPYLLESFDWLIQAYKTQDSYLIETAYQDLLIQDSLRSSQYHIIKESPLWNSKLLNDWGAVKPEYKKYFKQHVEPKGKLSVDQQTELLHKIIKDVIDVNDPRGLKKLSRKQLAERYPYQDADEMYAALHEEDKDIVKFNQPTQIIKQYETKQPAQQPEQSTGFFAKFKNLFSPSVKKADKVCKLDDYRK